MTGAHMHTSSTYQQAPIKRTMVCACHSRHMRDPKPVREETMVYNTCNTSLTSSPLAHIKIPQADDTLASTQVTYTCKE